ncbi:MAG: D-alanine--D-alanine ligase [Candidatus Margulisiibacteriota bacterium]|jgi:D-alanine-D-alanine ligase
MRVGVLMGGRSREREVSLRSGKNVSAALRRKGYQVVEIDPALQDIPKDLDIAYLVTHGRFGEDGCLQGLLEVMGIPYTGSGVLASALAMNKKVAKQIFSVTGIPTPPYCQDLIPPLIIKPVCEGSSLGVTRLKDHVALAEVQKIIAETTSEYGEVLVEKLIEGREITIGIVEDEVLPILELVPKSEFYDFEAKYTPGGTEFLLPAPLSPEVTSRMQAMALSAHHALGCEGVSRVDIMLDKDLNGYVIDVNTLPGMTDQSDLPAEAKAIGISFDDLVERILLSALKKKEPKQC